MIFKGFKQGDDGYDLFHVCKRPPGLLYGQWIRRNSTRRWWETHGWKVTAAWKRMTAMTMDATWETNVTVFICGRLNPPPHTPTWLCQCPKRLTWIYPDPLFQVTNSKQGRADPTRRSPHKAQKWCSVAGRLACGPKLLPPAAPGGRALLRQFRPQVRRHGRRASGPKASSRPPPRMGYFKAARWPRRGRGCLGVRAGPKHPLPDI